MLTVYVCYTVFVACVSCRPECVNFVCFCNCIAIVQEEGKQETLLYVLCTTMIGSQYIIDCLQSLVNKRKNNSNNNNNNNNNGNDLSEMKSIIFDFYTTISSFGHLLLVDEYGHCVIDKLLNICYKFDFIDVLKHFMKQIIVLNFSMLISQSYPHKIIKDMLNLNSKKFQIYVLKQLNCILNPQQSCDHDDNKHQPQQDECKLQNDSNDGVHQDNCKKKINFGKYSMLYNTINDNIGHFIILLMIEISCKLNIVNNILFYLLNFLSKYAHILSYNRFGCKIVQCCIVSQNVSYMNKRCIFVNLFKSLSDLCNNEYGNNSILKCIEYGDDEIRQSFIHNIFFGIDVNVKIFSNSKLFDAKYTLPDELKKSFENYMLNIQNPHTIINFCKFGFGKYSSVVCGIAFKYATHYQKQRLISYLSNPNILINNNVVLGLSNHEYGHYLIKNMIKTLVSLNGENDNNHIHNGVEQKVKNYSMLLNQLRDVLQCVFKLTSKYGDEKEFTFANSINQLLNAHSA